eukprot:TRINITY_DN66613_c5_g4_i2.p1 TRINITY_DN66613_c5_g4~~TRINITY_DN66613_c5_g4_i2.p1  ORF type:complete len:314 (+),score=182.27 TRINITY_DN66613_c5_g4_i2:70-1011(+)
MLDEYEIDFCVHGDDITTDENGVDCYEAVKKAGRFKEVKRTAGVSTTDLVGRMLLMTKDHLSLDVKQRKNEPEDDEDSKDMAVLSGSQVSPYTGVSAFVPSTRTLMNFMRGLRAPRPDDVIVYIDGAFDLAHAGHFEALRVAKSLGTYLICGVHSDVVVNRKKGNNYPIMNLHERILSVLQCKYVDEVVTGAPWKLNETIIKVLGINIVANGHSSDYQPEPGNPALDPYSVPRKLGIFKQFRSPLPHLTTSGIVERIIANRLKFEQRNRKKQKGEIQYMEKKLGVKLSSPLKTPSASPAASPSSSAIKKLQHQ